MFTPKHCSSCTVIACPTSATWFATGSRKPALCLNTVKLSALACWQPILFVVVQIVSSYMTMALLAAAPFMDKIEARTPLNHTVFYLIAFMTVFVLLFLLLSKSAFHQHLSEGKGSWGDVLILSIVQIGFLTSIVLSSMSGFALGHVSGITQIVFAKQPAPFIWTVLPIVALVVIRGKKK